MVLGDLLFYLTSIYDIKPLVLKFKFSTELTQNLTLINQNQPYVSFSKPKFEVYSL
jgi:hypothetical protein